MTNEDARAFLQGRIDLIDRCYPQIEDYREALDLAIKALEEQKVGKWIHWTDDYKDYATCSCCAYGEEGEVLLKDRTPYCPVCGARMEADDEK